MDHALDKLDECIFDYLASNPDRFIHHRQIFEDITGETGHRCSELTDSTEDHRRFLAVCYSMNHQYRNIRKEFHQKEIYLAFERDDVDSHLEPYHAKAWTGIPYSSVINHVFENDTSIYRDFDRDYYYEPFSSEPLLHEMIRYGVENRLVKELITDQNLSIDLENDHGATPLDVAISTQNKEMITFLIRLHDIRSRRETDRRREEENRQRDIQRSLERPKVSVTNKSTNQGMSYVQTAKYTVVAFGLGFGIYVGNSLVNAIGSLF